MKRSSVLRMCTNFVIGAREFSISKSQKDNIDEFTVGFKEYYDVVRVM